MGQSRLDKKIAVAKAAQDKLWLTLANAGRDYLLAHKNKGFTTTKEAMSVQAYAQTAFATQAINMILDWEGNDTGKEEAVTFAHGIWTIQANYLLEQDTEVGDAFKTGERVWKSDFAS